MSYQKVKTDSGYKIIDSSGAEVSHGLSEEVADQIIEELKEGDAFKTDDPVECRECMDSGKVWNVSTRDWNPCPYCS